MVGVAGGGVGSASGPIRKTGGGGGGGAVGLWPDTKNRVGCCRFLARYEERGGGGGGVLSVSGLIRKVGRRGMIAYRGARDILQ